MCTSHSKQTLVLRLSLGICRRFMARSGYIAKGRQERVTSIYILGSIEALTREHIWINAKEVRYPPAAILQLRATERILPVRRNGHRHVLAHIDYGQIVRIFIGRPDNTEIRQCSALPSSGVCSQNVVEGIG